MVLQDVAEHKNNALGMVQKVNFLNIWEEETSLVCSTFSRMWAHNWGIYKAKFRWGNNRKGEKVKKQNNVQLIHLYVYELYL